MTPAAPLPYSRCQVFMLVPPITYFVIGNIWLTLLLFVVNLGILIALFFLKNSYPCKL